MPPTGIKAAAPPSLPPSAEVSTLKLLLPFQGRDPMQVHPEKSG